MVRQVPKNGYGSSRVVDCGDAGNVIETHEHSVRAESGEFSFCATASLV